MGTFIVLVLCLVARETTKQAYCKTTESSESNAAQVNATSGTNTETHSAAAPYLENVINRQKRHLHNLPSLVKKTATQKPTTKAGIAKPVATKAGTTKARTTKAGPTKLVTTKAATTKTVTTRAGIAKPATTTHKGAAVTFIPSKILLVVVVMLIMTF